MTTGDVQGFSFKDTILRGVIFAGGKSNK